MAASSAAFLAWSAAPAAADTAPPTRFLAELKLKPKGMFAEGLVTAVVYASVGCKSTDDRFSGYQEQVCESVITSGVETAVQHDA